MIFKSHSKFFTSLTLCLLLVSSFTVVKSAEAAFFARELKIGSQGNDVLVLQRILNSDTATRVASSGSGSPGNETTYFGQLTKQALVKFQDKYAGEIIILANLETASGYVDSYTMRKLNAIIVKNPKFIENLVTESNPTPTNTTETAVNVVPKVTSVPKTTTATSGSASLFPFNGTFTRTLTLGMSGYDVQMLQKFLNSSSDTKIASTGAGSPGNETTYFGQLTKNAVIKYQNKYATKLVFPKGFYSGDGIFDSTTRNMVNLAIASNPQILAQSTQNTSNNSNSQTQTSTTNTGSQISTENAPDPKYIDPISGKQGDIITIHGNNLNLVNGILLKNDISFYYIWDFTSQDANKISFMLPYDISTGAYNLSLFDQSTDYIKSTRLTILN
ncbi:MAG: hypothetical protein WCW87_03575 [Candidatus Paceibacterota bacterium]